MNRCVRRDVEWNTMFLAPEVKVMVCTVMWQIDFIENANFFEHTYGHERTTSSNDQFDGNNLRRMGRTPSAPGCGQRREPEEKTGSDIRVEETSGLITSLHGGDDGPTRAGGVGR